MHYQNVHIVFNFMETAYLRTSQNKSHMKFKAFTLQMNYVVDSQWRANILMSEAKNPYKTDLSIQGLKNLVFSRLPGGQFTGKTRLPEHASTLPDILNK